MEYYEDKLCISKNDLVGAGVMSEANYKYLSSKGCFKIARQGKGLGKYALVIVDTLPDRFKEKVHEAFPGGNHIMLDGWVRSNYELDQEAVVFFNDRAQTGVELDENKKHEYIVNASVLKCCIRLYASASEYRRLMGDKYDWSMMAASIESCRQQFGHTLPSSPLRFRKKVAEFKRLGYGCLISGKFGNQSARKVDYKTERLVISLATLPNRPYNSNVHELYNSFVCGEIDVYDPTTGEAFDPEVFTDKDGNPKELSPSTINNILNAPKNQVLIRAALDSYTTFMHETMPHMHRHAPEFSLSKVTFDDRDLPRKLKDSKQRPKAYYAYDVASQCCIGFAYNRSKTEDLVTDMFRHMFRLLERKGWGCPAQVEVENHLMTKYKKGFLKAGEMFPFVRFCAPMNSQEKYSEVMNGAKKRSVEHRNHIGIGRFYAENKCYRTESKKVFDEFNDTYEEKEYYTWEELISDDMMDIMQFNNSLHPNQKKYPGMTRWQVLEANINPTLKPIDKASLTRYIGEKVHTSIRRNSYCRVSYTDWWLSSTSVLEKLEPNNYEVDAYYIPGKDGEIKDVYIYQGEKLIDKLQNVGTFNTADCEQTEEDKAIFVEQRKKINEFRSYVKDRSIARVGVLKKSDAPEPEAVEAEPVAVQAEEMDYTSVNDWGADGRESV